MVLDMSNRIAELQKRATGTRATRKNAAAAAAFRRLAKRSNDGIRFATSTQAENNMERTAPTDAPVTSTGRSARRVLKLSREGVRVIV
jgi:hypothetical protein